MSTDISIDAAGNVVFRKVERARRTVYGWEMNDKTYISPFNPGDFQRDPRPYNEYGSRNEAEAAMAGRAQVEWL